MRRIKIYNLSTGTVGVPFFGTINPEGKADLTLNNTDADFIVSGLSALEDSGKIALEVINLDGGDPVTKTSAKMDIYVDGDNGDDANAGTQGSPLQTLTEAESRIPDVIYHDVVVHIATAAAPYTMPVIRERLYRAGWLVFYGDGAGVDDGFTELVASTVAQSGTNTVQVVTGGGLGTNTYQGKTVEVLDGAAAGERRIIRDHDDTTLVPTNNFNGAIAQGDSVRIVEPSVQVDTPDNQWVGESRYQAAADGLDVPMGPTLMLAQLKIGGAQRLQFTQSAVLYGIEFASGGLHVVSAADCRAGSDLGRGVRGTTQAANSLLGISADLYGWGISSDSSLFLWGHGRYDVVGIVCDSLTISNDANAVCTGGTAFAGGVTVQRAEGSFFGDTAGSDIDFKVVGNSVIKQRSRAWFSAADLDASASGDALLISEGSSVRILTKSDKRIDAAGIGILCEQHSQCYIEAASGLPGMTTGTADTRIQDGSTDKAIGTYAAGDYINGGEGSVIQRVS